MNFFKYWKLKALERDAERLGREVKALQETYGKFYPSGTSNAKGRRGSPLRHGLNKPPKTPRIVKSRGSSLSGAIKSRGTFRYRWKNSSTFYEKLMALIDSIGDLIVVLSASIAAGSGLSAWRLLRRVKNLESQVKTCQYRVDDTREKVWDMEKKWHDQTIFNNIIEEELDKLGEQPAPKQNKKMGTPRPATAKGFLYGRTPKGP